jgi:cytochrome c peroxidase
MSCQKSKNAEVGDEVLNRYLNLPPTPFNYSAPSLPKHFFDEFVASQLNTPGNNRVTDWGATLGRVLFYDRRLSGNKQIACASCHHQQLGFTDSVRFSRGHKGFTTLRHSMSLTNAAYYANGRFFWDERAQTLEDQVLMPIQDTLEMGQSLSGLLETLRQTPIYPILFRYAFGSEEISEEGLSKALAQFVRAMVSFRSKYDYGLSQVDNRMSPFPNFSPGENRGKEVFFLNSKINCSGCHTTDLFVLDNPRNNGLYPQNHDKGVAIHTGSPEDEGKFKAPSLRNVGLRKHYMHDGSIHTLHEVVQHYNTGIKSNPTLDPHLMHDGEPIQMMLTKEEVDDLVAFLHTLTDFEFAADKRFSDPFKK